jgi:hypothetical protein
MRCLATEGASEDLFDNKMCQSIGFMGGHNVGRAHSTDSSDATNVPSGMVSALLSDKEDFKRDFHSFEAREHSTQMIEHSSV